VNTEVRADHRVWTCWYREVPGSAKPEYNHLQVGYDPQVTAPEAVTQEQRKAWAHVRWISRRAIMIGGQIVEREA
jgi:hypothetical protein